MSLLKDIHATCCAQLLNGYHKGILIQGQSGFGKSMLAASLIWESGFSLVSDDRTRISLENGRIFAHYDSAYQGKIEIRYVGICDVPFAEKAEIIGVVELVDAMDCSRLPEMCFWNFEGHEVQKITLPRHEEGNKLRTLFFMQSLLK